MAFVLVQHLAPDHKSLLTELIQRSTKLPVHEISDGTEVAPNNVYIIPPGHDLALVNGILQLIEHSQPRGRRLSIDFFFQSLALDQHERAIAIVLSGTGSDGSLGLRAIKADGGLVLAQSTDTTEFAGMPQAAIATGLVDFVLPAAEMPAKLLAYVAHSFGKLLRPFASPRPHSDNTLRKIFAVLRSQTGHDFSQYKSSTIHRRIERRLAVHQISSAEHYVLFLNQTPAEVQALFFDLLIGVTGFFRDPEAFQVLEEVVIPRLFAAHTPGDAIRVWSVGCSTGEEAYSVAMLLHERMELLHQNFVLQVFATDLDSRAIAFARAGLYSVGIAADLSPDRLARYFTAEPGNLDGTSGYRIHKSIRDLLVFSEQDLIKDPPFSRLDLLCCRNLLIYLNSDLQKRLIPLFHYALNPGGTLFLGTSEGIGDHASLFEVLDRQSKLFSRGGGAAEVRSEAAAPVQVSRPHLPVVQSRRLKVASPPPSLRELAERTLLQQVTPSSALVDVSGKLLFLHGRMGEFLEPSPGEVEPSNVLTMAREGLKTELAIALHRAATTLEKVLSPGLTIVTARHRARVNLTVQPVEQVHLGAVGEMLFLVTLDELLEPSADEVPPPEEETRVVGLQRELRAKDDFLVSTLEQLESSNEELKSANEEMQSVNEELQSTNEELETSKEELQSVNEELATVNAELQSKVTALSRANNDMNNLLAGTGIGTVFVDHKLQILRFTPDAKHLIHLIPSDVGRNIGHQVTRLLDYHTLVADIESVLDSLVPREVVVKSDEGLWYKMRIQPYRTLDNVIEGAVVSFVDISEVLETRQALQKAQDLARLAIVVRDSHDAITVQDLEGRILAWNPGAQRLYGWTEEEALAMNVRDRVPEPLRKRALARVHQLSLAKVIQPYQTQRLTKDGTLLKVTLVSTALVNPAGAMYAIATTERLQEVVNDQP
jgi:two-component system CheB/CheR fusion protein